MGRRVNEVGLDADMLSLIIYNHYNFSDTGCAVDSTCRHSLQDYL